MTSAPLPSTDPALAPFLTPSFSATDYLNSILPSWSPAPAPAPTTAPSQAAPKQQQQQTPLAALTHEAQDLLTQLAASLTRLNNTLNALTDDILRSGSRLAYEVEVLRGDVGSLNEALTSDADAGLKAEFERLGVRGLPSASAPPAARTADGVGRTQDGSDPRSGTVNGSRNEAADQQQAEEEIKQDRPPQPDYIRTLHVLTRVRANLDRVVAVFGAATEWVMPPSELAARGGGGGGGSASTADADADAESQGREYAARVRDEVKLLLDGEGDGEGLEAAAKRVRELRDLVAVWKGTAEEKPRGRFVDSLEKMVAEQRER